MKKVLIAALIIFAILLFSFCGETDNTATQNEVATQKIVTTEEQEPTDTAVETTSEVATKEPTDISTEPPTQTPTEEPTEPPTEAVEETTKREVMVWIPNSGSKYHSRAGCSNMKNPSQVTLEKAQSWGYTPCKKCN
ncbi:MAG: hypothetical protein E7523_06240 [Ruminococcaceae bacterium]|nr:hypothetical protein [Oscillospiraceae bacterium]